MLRPSKPLTSNISQRLGLLFLGMALAEVFFLSSLVPLDATFAGWVEAHRSCELDEVALRLQAWLLPSLVALGIPQNGDLISRAPAAGEISSDRETE